MTETPFSSFAPSSRPPSLVALDAYPLLRASVDASLAQQAAYVAEQTATFRGRRLALRALDEAIRSLAGGLLVLEGPPGSGVSALLAHLAATRPAAFWFAEQDAFQGAAALCVQLIGLSGSMLPLAPPAANSDPRVFGQVLEEVSARRSSDAPLLVVVDPLSWGSQLRDPVAVVWPRPLPPGLLVVYGSQPGEEGTGPGEAQGRLTLPSASEAEEVRHDQTRMLREAACPDEWADLLLTAAQGNFLYLRLAYGLSRSGVLDVHSLRPGLDALYEAWWSSLGAQGRRLALLLAAADEAVALEMGAALSGGDPLPLLSAWGPLVRLQQGQMRLAHWSLRSYLARYEHEALRQVHAEIASLVLAVEPGMGGDAVGGDVSGAGLPSAQVAQTAGMSYLSRQFSRHARLGHSTAGTCFCRWSGSVSGYAVRSGARTRCAMPHGTRHGTWVVQQTPPWFRNGAQETRRARRGQGAGGLRIGSCGWGAAPYWRERWHRWRGICRRMQRWRRFAWRWSRAGARPGCGGCWPSWISFRMGLPSTGVAAAWRGVPRGGHAFVSHAAVVAGVGP
ncbi:MAG: ATP-binding protein [Chloroflexaceae bacterium]|nr:ATP-binding protein [Chloroflexaceae bacterium]